MLRVRLYLKDIDYISILNLVMPYMEKWLSKNNNTLLELLKNLISKEGKPSGFSKFIVNILPCKDNILTSVVSNNGAVFTAYLNDLLRKNGIVVCIEKLYVVTVEGSKNDMLKVEVTIDAIDYEETMENLVPMILQKMSETENNTRKLAELLLSLNELPINMLKAAIGVVPRYQRDELLTKFLSLYTQEITEVLNSTLSKNNIKAEIEQINITPQ